MDLFADDFETGAPEVPMNLDTAAHQAFPRGSQPWQRQWLACYNEVNIELTSAPLPSTQD